MSTVFSEATVEWARARLVEISTDLEAKRVALAGAQTAFDAAQALYDELVLIANQTGLSGVIR